VLEFCGYLKPVEQKTDPKDFGTGHSGSNVRPTGFQQFASRLTAS
jgi:hypothetical protein